MYTNQKGSNMTVPENLKINLKRNLLKIKNVFSKVRGFKIHRQKSMVPLFTSNKQVDTEIQNMIDTICNRLTIGSNVTKHVFEYIQKTTKS